VEDHRTAPGTAGLHMVAGLPLLRPEERAFAKMLDGLGQLATGTQSRARDRGGHTPPDNARCWSPDR
jgi:hypothetical protein